MEDENFDSFLQLTEKLYRIDEIKAEGILQFIESEINKRHMHIVFKLIMIFKRNNFNSTELTNIALHYKDTFRVNLDEIFNTKKEEGSKDAVFHAAFLIERGIAKESFKNFDLEKLTGKKYKRKSKSKPLEAIEADDLNQFNKAVGGYFNASAPMLAGKYKMTYLSWAALFKSVNVFIFLTSRTQLDRRTVKIAIKKGNRRILNKIFEDERIKPYNYMRSLIKYHRNHIIKQVKIAEDTNNEELLIVARKNLNYLAYAIFSANPRSEL
jgi:hypothetical protein